MARTALSQKQDERLGMDLYIDDKSRLLRSAYWIYGLNLDSNVSISGLRLRPVESTNTDLILDFGFEPGWVHAGMRLPSSVLCSKSAMPETADPTFRLSVWGAGEFFELAYGDGTRFVLDGATRNLWGTWTAPLVIEDAATYLLGPVMGFILRRRNVVALHASSVCIGEHSVVLCGESQVGKSTTAAAMALAGIPVLTEDIAPITDHNGTLYVESGYPRICLWPQAVEHLLGAPDALPRLTPGWEKCFLALDGALGKFEPQARPLGAVYLFAPRSEEANAPRVDELSPRSAVLELVQNTYMNWLLNQAQRAAELDVLTRIVAQVPVRRIVPHADPARIGALSELIVADSGQLLTQQRSAAKSIR